MYRCELTDHLRTFSVLWMTDEQQREANHLLLWMNSDRRWIKTGETK